MSKNEGKVIRVYMDEQLDIKIRKIIINLGKLMFTEREELLRFELYYSSDKVRRFADIDREEFSSLCKEYLHYYDLYKRYNKKKDNKEQ